MNEDEADRKIDEHIQECLKKWGIEHQKTDEEKSIGLINELRNGGRLIAKDMKRKGASKAMFLGAMGAVIDAAGEGRPELDRRMMKGYMLALYTEIWDEMEKEMEDS